MIGSRDKDRAMHAADRIYRRLFGVGGETAIACDDQRINEALPTPPVEYGRDVRRSETGT